MNTFSYSAMIRGAAAEIILALAVLVVLTLDLVILRGAAQGRRRAILAGTSLLGCLGALVAIVATGSISFPGRMVMIDELTQLAKAALVVLAIFSLLISSGGSWQRHPGEYFAILLAGTIGMLFLISTENILMIFVALELASLSLYLLTAFNKGEIKSAEAGLKYFLFGGISAAFTLYGLSLLYGASGALELREIAAAVQLRAADPLVSLALVLTVIGFGFKVAAVPLHFWAPDAYQGAPAGAASFIASASKLASFFIFLKVIWVGFAGMEGSAAWHRYAPGWLPVLAFLAVSSMILGNLGAIVQKSVRRLLAYSAIGHAGYMMLGMIAHERAGVVSLIFYAATYGLSVIGAFAIAALIEEADGNDEMPSFAGLSRRSPALALCLLIFMLSLAGIPPLAGFFGKFYLFVAAARTKDLGLLWLVVVAIATSVVSLYYYLQVLKQAYVTAPPDGAKELNGAVFPRAIIVLLAAGVVLFGCAPQILLKPLLAAVQAWP